MQFSPLALAALLPLLSMVSADSNICTDGSAATNMHLSWYPELEIPHTTANNNLFDAALYKKKLGQHNFDFFITASNNRAHINIYNGHGDQEFFRVNYKGGNGKLVHSFLVWSRNLGCDSEVDVDQALVKSVTVEMAKNI